MDDLDSLHRDLATAVILFHEAGARRLGMTAAERKCAGILAGLHKATPKQLAELTGLSTGAITGIVDRLERAGYADRRPNPEDRRSVIVHARNVPKLMERMGPTFTELTQAMNALNARYTAEQRELILRHLTDTISILREQTAKLRSSE